MKYLALAFVVFAGGQYETDVRQWFDSEAECKIYLRVDLCNWHPGADWVHGICLSEGQVATGEAQSFRDHFEVFSCQ